MGGVCVSGDNRGDSQLDGLPINQKPISKAKSCGENKHLNIQ